MADGPTLYDDAEDPYRAIRVGDTGGGADAAKWGALLSGFMRIVAVFWLLQGLAHWHIILTSAQSIFEIMPRSGALSNIFFAVLDLIAGVGLWLATPWGGVLWLLIASAQIFLTLSMPNFFLGGYALIGVNAVLIVIYFTLTFEAGRDVESQRLRERRRRRKVVAKNAPPPPPERAPTQKKA